MSALEGPGRSPGDDAPPVCDYEGSTYQARFWGSGEREYEDRAEAAALAALLPTTGRRLLEVGAGAGRNTPRYVGFDRVVLVDYSRTQLEEAKARLDPSDPAGDRYTYVAADVYRLPFVAAAFDAATMIRVAHHLVDPDAALAQVRAALAPGATFVFEFANKRNLKAIARWATRTQRWSPFSPEPAEILELNYDFHPKTMLAALGRAGFVVESVRSLSYFRLGALKRMVPTGVLVGADRALQPTGRWVQLSPSVFVLARAQGAAPPTDALPTAVFRCPVCGSTELAPAPEGDHLACGGCARHWAIVGGIHDFKVPA